MKKKCLIVDDDLTTCFMLKVILEDHFECDIAVNGDLAISIFEKGHREGSYYSLVCLDMNMPGMNGQEVLKRIRDLESSWAVSPGLETRVIIISSDDTSSTVLNSFFAGGASSYITKPIKRQKLLDELATLELL